MKSVSFSLCLALCATHLSCFPLPKDEYIYGNERDLLLQQEELFQGNKPKLSEDEKIVDRYLGYLKWAEFERTRPAVPPSRPLQEVLADVTASQLYAALRELPKGGNMHLHEDHVVSKRTLLDIVFASEDFPHLYMIGENHTDAWKLDFFINPPEGEGWINVKDTPYYTKERIFQHQTFIGIMDEEAKKYPTDSVMRWEQMNPLWSRGSFQLIDNIKIKTKYDEAMLEAAMMESVQYLESRKELKGSLYTLDASPKYKSTHGKRLLDDKEGEVELNLTISTVNRFIKEHPDFIGLKFISFSSRKSNHSEVQTAIDRTKRFHKQFPKWIVGYDLVAEEDSGNSHLFFLDDLLKLYDEKTGRTAVDLFPHTGETNFPTDERMSTNPEDPTSALQNIYDAIAMGAKRVGHGIGYIKHPVLLDILKQQNIAVEACPMSNQLLGYIADVRNHPAQTYIRYGIPVVMGADDPGTFGYDNFTVDWYMAYLGWGLDLADLKLFGLNAIFYSAMNNDEKSLALSKFAKSWNKYIDKKKNEACTKTFQSSPIFSKLLPNLGPRTKSTMVNIFGSNFEPGICKNIKCKFGDLITTKAELVSTQLIRCQTPGMSGLRHWRSMQKKMKEHALRYFIPDETVKVYVSLDGSHYIDTGKTFTFVEPGNEKMHHRSNSVLSLFFNEEQDSVERGNL